MSEQSRTDRDPVDSGPEGPQPRGADFGSEFQNAVAIGDQVIGYLGSLGELARLEIGLALESIPRLLSAWALLIPLALLVWVSVSATLAWSGYSLSGYPLVGLACFSLLQLVAAAAVAYKLRRYRQRLKLPNTRRELNRMREMVRREIEPKSKTGE